MRLIYFLFIPVIFICACSRIFKNNIPSYLIDKLTCQNDWTYSKLDKKIVGTILAYKPSNSLCGNSAFASITIIKTTANDTVRILQLCNYSKLFNKSDLVEIEPAEVPSFKVNVDFDEFTCNVKKTYYGVATKL